MLKKSLFFFFMFFAIVSCKKERTINITATNPATGQRIPNLHYYLVELTQGSFDEKSKTVREGDLDANGEAKFNFKIKNKTHVIRVVRPENNCYAENLSLTFDSKENINADFKFAPCAFYQNTITNVNCLGTDDKLEFSVSRFVDNNYESSWIIMGCNGYVPSHYSSIPMGNLYLRWTVTKSGLSNTFYNTLYLNENSYTSYSLDY